MLFTQLRPITLTFNQFLIGLLSLHLSELVSRSLKYIRTIIQGCFASSMSGGTPHGRPSEQAIFFYSWAKNTIFGFNMIILPQDTVYQANRNI